MFFPRALSGAVRMLAVLALVAVGSGLAASPARATPSLTQIQKQINTLTTQMEVTTEQYNEANTALSTTRSKVAGLEKSAAPARAELKSVEKVLTDSAVTAYVNGNLGTARALFTTGTPQAFLDQVTYLEQVSTGQRAAVDRALTKKKALDVKLKPLTDAMTRQTAQEKAIAAKKAKIQKDLASWRKLRDKAIGLGAPTKPGDLGSYNGKVNGRVGEVIDYAVAQLGDPYVFAAAGPNSFDCSGLTMAAWAKAGVRMEHGARAQYAAFPKVSRADLQPGDLIFYGSPIHHVALYLGNGKVIHAPNEGDVVRIVTVDRGGGSYTGAVRPG